MHMRFAIIIIIITIAACISNGKYPYMKSCITLINIASACAGGPPSVRYEKCIITPCLAHPDLWVGARPQGALVAIKFR